MLCWRYGEDWEVPMTCMDEDEDEKPPTDADRVSLAPLDPEVALRALLQVRPSPDSGGDAPTRQHSAKPDPTDE